MFEEVARLKPCAMLELRNSKYIGLGPRAHLQVILSKAHPMIGCYYAILYRECASDKIQGLMAGNDRRTALAANHL
jgi:hypothetical protein